MPGAHHPAGQADEHSDDESTSRRAHRGVPDRHGRREPTVAATNGTGPRATTGPRQSTGPGWAVSPPTTVPMSAEQHDNAVRAWAALIAAWWADHPPDQHHEDRP